MRIELKQYLLFSTKVSPNPQHEPALGASNLRESSSSLPNDRIFQISNYNDESPSELAIEESISRFFPYN